MHTHATSPRGGSRVNDLSEPCLVDDDYLVSYVRMRTPFSCGGERDRGRDDKLHVSRLDNDQYKRRRIAAVPRSLFLFHQRGARVYFIRFRPPYDRYGMSSIHPRDSRADTLPRILKSLIEISTRNPRRETFQLRRCVAAAKCHLSRFLQTVSMAAACAFVLAECIAKYDTIVERMSDPELTEMGPEVIRGHIPNGCALLRCLREVLGILQYKSGRDRLTFCFCSLR